MNIREHGTPEHARGQHRRVVAKKTEWMIKGSGRLREGSGCVGSTFRPKPGWLECLRKLQDNIMLNNTLSQLSRG